jgi:hypothetical protein
MPYAPLTKSNLVVKKDETFNPVTTEKIIQVDFVGITTPFIISLMYLILPQNNINETKIAT